MVTCRGKMRIPLEGSVKADIQWHRVEVLVFLASMYLQRKLDIGLCMFTEPLGYRRFPMAFPADGAASIHRIISLPSGFERIPLAHRLSGKRGPLNTRNSWPGISSSC